MKQAGDLMQPIEKPVSFESQHCEEMNYQNQDSVETGAQLGVPVFRPFSEARR